MTSSSYAKKAKQKPLRSVSGCFLDCLVGMFRRSLKRTTLSRKPCKEELTERINMVMTADRLGPAEALSLRSRLLFAESQIFGRTAKRALQTVGEVGLGTSTMSPLSPQLKTSLAWLRDRVFAAASTTDKC